MTANTNRKVLLWKSYGHVSVYALDIESQYIQAYDELTKCSELGGFAYEGSMDIKELIRWINLEVADDWDLFEYLAIEEVQESVPTK